MTASTDPQNAQVLLVGFNQRTSYPQSSITHSEFIDALFNRNGMSCRGLYNKVTNSKPSPTRNNIDNFVRRIKELSVLETNVVCYSTKTGADARKDKHAEHGRKIFEFLLNRIAAKILIYHGQGTRKELSRLAGKKLPVAPKMGGRVVKEAVEIDQRNFIAYPIRSLAPPEFNKWSNWAQQYFDDLAQDLLATAVKCH